MILRFGPWLLCAGLALGCWALWERSSSAGAALKAAELERDAARATITEMELQQLLADRVLVQRERDRQATDRRLSKALRDLSEVDDACLDAAVPAAIGELLKPVGDQGLPLRPGEPSDQPAAP